jgi:hypothetical protein
MVAIRGAVIGFFTGLLLAGGWWVFIDAQINTTVAFPTMHIIPPLLCTIAGIMINLVSIQQVNSGTAIKVWLFAWLTIICISIGWAVFVTVREYPPTSANYPGVAIILQTIMVSFAALLLFAGRKPISTDNFIS